MTEDFFITVRPVGFVRGEGDTCEIEVRPAYVDGLLGIEQAEELQILYWMHRLGDAERRLLTAHPMGETSRPRRGVFALRSPMRPNPIGSTVVKLLEVEGNRLRVRGLDALDGSPVVDIKIVS